MGSKIGGLGGSPLKPQSSRILGPPPQMDTWGLGPPPQMDTQGTPNRRGPDLDCGGGPKSGGWGVTLKASKFTCRTLQEVGPDRGSIKPRADVKTGDK